ncbi:hypothetical protein EJB05_12276, partial [Eragrostis curvula]
MGSSPPLQSTVNREPLAAVGAQDIFAYAANFPIKKFLQAQSIVRPSALISAAALALHVALSWLVIRHVAVGCGWQAFVAYVNVGCYYVVGVPLGIFLGFYLDFGAKGVWSGMVIGGTLMQTLILLWFTFRTDWHKEVEKAKARLEKWEDKSRPLLEG